MRSSRATPRRRPLGNAATTAFLLAASLAAAFPLEAQEPASRPVAESRSAASRQFLGFYDGEAKIGSGVLEQSLDPVSGATRIELHGSVDVRLAPDKMPMAYSRVVEFDPAGLLTLASETLEVAKPVTRSVVVEERSVKNGSAGAVWSKTVSRRSEDGKTTKTGEESQKGPALKLTLAEHERDRAWIKGGAAPGGTLACQRIDFAQRKVRPARLALIKRTATKAPGIEVRTAICSETDDAQRTVLRAFGPEGSIAFLELENGWIARGEPDGLAQSAIGWDGHFAASIIPKTPLSPPGATKRADLVIGGTAAFLLESRPGHEVVVDGSAFATVRLDLAARASTAPTPAERTRLTEATADLPVNDRAISDFAKSAAKLAASQSEQDVVVSLVAAVRETVSSVPAPQGLSAAQILEHRRGGARGRSLLLVAAARSLKLPAREVRGLALRVEDPRLFVPHSWVEIEVDDAWESVDPTYGQIPADLFRLRCRPLRPRDPLVDPNGPLTIDLKP